MDSAWVSGTQNPGSIPGEATNWLITHKEISRGTQGVQHNERVGDRSLLHVSMLGVMRSAKRSNDFIPTISSLWVPDLNTEPSEGIPEETSMKQLLIDSLPTMTQCRYAIKLLILQMSLQIYKKLIQIISFGVGCFFPCFLCFFVVYFVMGR